MSPRLLPLHDEHTALGARMVESEGWSLPLEFGGVFKEYQAHRRRSVVWDASDLGRISVAGPAAFEVVQHTFTNDLRRIRPGRSQYTYLLTPDTAGVADDLMVWWLHDDEFVLTPSRPEAVLTALCARRDELGHDSGVCRIEDISSGRVLLAVQGAKAAETLAALAPDAPPLPRAGVCDITLHGQPGRLSATGFGRQAGYELDLPTAAARAVYRELVGQGVTPVGVAMRETHRIENGIPRYGYELGPSISPLEAGGARSVAFDTPFVGRPALTAHQERGVERVLRTVVMETRQAPPPGGELVHDGTVVGRITSGNYSPRLHRGLGFAFVDTRIEVGATVTAGGDAKGEIATVPVGLKGAR